MTRRSRGPVRGLPACRRCIGLALMGAFLLSCAGFPIQNDGPRGIYHRVKSGETLWVIAKAYHIKLQDLAEINNISNPDQIEADSVIFIPDANQVVDDVLAAVQSEQPPKAMTVPDAPPAGKKTPAPALSRKEPVKREPAQKAPAAESEASPASLPPVVAKQERPAPARPPVQTQGAAPAVPPARPGEGDGKAEGLQFDKDRFIWPVKGKLLSRFGIQPNRMYLNGIRIAAAEGAAVLAAAGGVVIYSAPLKGYGETIIIKHDDAYATVYTHLETRTVRGDARVKKGDRIAFLGKIDNQEEPYLHFEVRYKNKARNPLFFLP
ncbi:MAG: peptidoglycan DD-metalloendopeptidase family protein [Deltaproteobacteria bacterium]|nr:peptidoglycan DD-metalloendopeptidase family protein [Deltaproteobacteria bacterium]